MARRAGDDDDEPVPRLPRGKGLALSTGQIVRIVMVAAALVALISLQGPCSKSMSRFVTSFDGTDAAVRRVDAAPAPPKAPSGELLRATMTPAELEAAIARERARAAAADVDAGVASDAAPPPL